MLRGLNALVIEAALGWPRRAWDHLRGQDGQGFVEYALVLTLVAAGFVLLLQWGAFTTALHGSLKRVIDEVNSAGT